jgi:glucokinase
VLDLAGRIEARAAFPTRAERGGSAVVREFGKHAGNLLRRSRIARNKVIGAGVASAGVLEPGAGRVVQSFGLGWRDLPLKEMLEDELGVPTLIDTDTAGHALAETHWGVGQGASNLMLFELDYFGCGTTLIVDGRIVRGCRNVAGEIGGLIVPRHGGGEPAILHKVASGWSIVAKARGTPIDEALAAQPRVGELTAYGPELRAVFDAAREGEPRALAAVREAAEAVAISIANLVMALNPELVVLTGRVIDESGGTFTPMVRDMTLARLDLGELRALRIEESQLGETAALLGAATLVYDELFRPPAIRR